MSARGKACAAIILAFAATTPKKTRRWMREWLKERQKYTHTNLLHENRALEPDDFQNYFRMNDWMLKSSLKC
jgi:hypothetical protein